MISFHPAAQELTVLLIGVSDDQLAAPTPCPDWTLGQLVDHISGFSLVFEATARKDLGELTQATPDPDAGTLESGWRERITRQLAALAEAWDDPAAWVGSSQAGGATAPAGMMGGFALNEIVVHGWDVAKSTGQTRNFDPAILEYLVDFAVATTGDGDSGPFGRPVPVPESAPLLDRLVALRGRDRDWRPATS